MFLGRECVDPGAGAGAGDSDLRMVILRSTCRPLSLTHGHPQHRSLHTQTHTGGEKVQFRLWGNTPLRVG